MDEMVQQMAHGGANNNGKWAGLTACYIRVKGWVRWVGLVISMCTFGAVI